MSRSGGRSILGEIGRQIIDMLEEASREVTQPPYAQPERPPRDRPRREVPRQPEAPPVEVTPDEMWEPERSRRVREEPPAPRRPVGVSRTFRSQLRSKSAVRRALVMSEILGPPRSMSDDPFR